MGPNVLWLTEEVTNHMSIAPGMRVLDLGCGRALSSLFVAKEFEAQVWAADLWIKPTENFERVKAEGLSDRVFPISAEAHALPFAHGFFDAAVSLDAFHYFGTDDLYLRQFARFLRPGAQFGIAVPGLVEEIDEVPAHLQPGWDPDFWSFHSPAWWRRHFERSGMFRVDYAGLAPEGVALWQRWLELCDVDGFGGNATELEMVTADGGKNLGFTILVATRIRRAPRRSLHL